MVTEDRWIEMTDDTFTRLSEGGFDPEERALVRANAFVVPVTLGPRIMRADTASLAALALWQAVIGDWRGSL